MTPYSLNREAIADFMRYHGLKNMRDVAEILAISPAYLSQVLSGARGLSEHLRLRLQIITRKSQDQLFTPARIFALAFSRSCHRARTTTPNLSLGDSGTPARSITAASFGS